MVSVWMRCIVSFSSLISFFFNFYLFMIVTERERERGRDIGRGRSRLHAPGARCGIRSRVSRIVPWAKGRRQTAAPPRDPSSLISLDSTSETRLTRRTENRHVCLGPDVQEKIFMLSSLNVMWVILSHTYPLSGSVTFLLASWEFYYNGFCVVFLFFWDGCIIFLFLFFF